MSAPFAYVLFIGGPPGVGKTTVASVLARRHGLRLYSADTRTWEHRDRAIAAGMPAAIAWEGLSQSERREQSDAELVAQSLYRERGAMALDDVALLPRSPLIVAEGTVIRPADVPADAAAVWLFADAATQSMRLRERDGQRNRLYELMLGVIATDVEAALAPTIETGTVHETVTAVEVFFRSQLARGPLATSLVERRALLREANLDIVNQVRGYFARPWAVGNPEAVVRTFMCECGHPSCEAFIEDTVRDVAWQPSFEASHAL